MTQITVPPPVAAARSTAIDTPKHGARDTRFMDLVQTQGGPSVASVDAEGEGTDGRMAGSAHLSAAATDASPRPAVDLVQPAVTDHGFATLGTPDGSHEDARLFPQRLIAHGYLDQLPQTARPTGAGSDPMTPVRLSDAHVAGARVPSPTLGASHRGVAAAAPGASQTGQTGPGAVRVGVSEETSADPAGASRLLKAPSNGAMPAHWARRAAHLIHGEDGTATVWLRDFDLGDADASVLVDAARATWPEAKRVMLNGQQAWSIHEKESVR